MIKNKKKNFFLLTGYFLLASIWALTVGFNFNEMLTYEGSKNYDNIVVDISNSYLTDTGELTLCLSGYLADSKKYRSELSDFSISIPILDIWNSNSYQSNDIKVTSYESIQMSIFDSAYSTKCMSSEVRGKEVSIVRLNLTKQEMISFNEYDYVENMKFDLNDEFKVVTVPNYSYAQGLYPVTLNLFIVGQVSDIAGRKYYATYFEDSVIYREVGFGDYIKAFLRDILLFPVQVFMFFNWH